MQTQVVLASGALPALLSLLSSPKEGIRKEACWTVSNITAGSPQQIQAVIDANIIPPLINILQNADFKTKKEACWVSLLSFLFSLSRYGFANSVSNRQCQTLPVEDFKNLLKFVTWFLKDVSNLSAICSRAPITKSSKCVFFSALF